MIDTSNEYKKLIMNDERFLKSKTVINNQEYDDSVVKSINYHSSIVSGSNFTIGSTNASTVEIICNDQLTDLREDMEVRPFIGIENTYIPLGVFYIDSVFIDRNEKVTKIKAKDKMMYLNDIYNSKLEFPTSIRDIVQEISSIIGTEFIPDNISTDKFVGFIPKTTIREFLGYLAQIDSAFVVFDREGKLAFKKLKRIDRKITKNNYFLKGLVFDDIDFRVNGISADTKAQGKSILAAGSAIGTQIKLTNPLMTQSFLNTIYDDIRNLRFKPYTLNWQGDPSIEVGDFIQIEVSNEEYIGVPVFDLKIDYAGGIKSTISAKVKGSSSTSYEYKGDVQRQIEFLDARVGADGSKIYADVLEPDTAKEGDTWFKPNGVYTELYVYTEGKWVLKISTGNLNDLITKITTDEVLAPKLGAGIAKIIELDASKITSGYLSSDRLKAGSITSTLIDDDAKTELRKGLITESNFEVLSNEINSSISKIKENKTNISKINQRSDEIESNIYLASTGSDILFKLENHTIDEVYESELTLDADSFYEFKLKSRGECNVLIKMFLDSDKRKYPYKYAKKHKPYVRVLKRYNSNNMVNRLQYFKTPAGLRRVKLYITGNGLIEFFRVSKNATKTNLEKITQLRQDLNGFKLTVQDNQNDIRSEIVQKSNEITQKIVDERAKTTNQIQQINDNLNLKVSKDKLISEINLSPEKIKIKSELLEVSGDLIVEGDLWAYKGEIGGFKLGEEKGHKWLTGATNFNVGMSDGLRGSGRRTALWANWGDDWVSPNDDAWYVRDDGSMYCGVGATFQSGFQSWGVIRVGSALKIDSSDISYNETNKVVWHSQLNNSSDFRLKENINKCEIRALDTINDIDVVQFDWKKEAEKDGHEDIGFVAQWLEKQVPKSIRADGNGFKSIRYSDLVPYLVKAIQELSVKVDKLEDENRKLKEGYNGSNTY